MDKKEFLKIVTKYNQGNATAEEKAFLEAYDKLFDTQEDILNQINSVDKHNLKEGIRSYITQHLEQEIPVKKASSWNWKWVAASILIIFSAVALLYDFSGQNKTEHAETLDKKATVITPGSAQAVLTLANGKKIILNDESTGLLSKKAGVTITKNEDGILQYEVAANAEVAINTMTTPRGGQYQLVLSDGTKVWLNADSKIIFPTRFNGNERKVEVLGEAYFEVAKNKNKPFKVVSENQVIEVLGTHFNVNNYKDEVVAKTTLLEGSIKISALQNGTISKTSSQILKPSEQAQITKGRTEIDVVKADLQTAVAWKNGYFRFNRTDMESMMRQVARWYDVDVEYRGEISKDLFAGNLKRSDEIKEVLRILQLSKVNASIKGKTIIITN